MSSKKWIAINIWFDTDKKDVEKIDEIVIIGISSSLEEAQKLIRPEIEERIIQFFDEVEEDKNLVEKDEIEIIGFTTSYIFDDLYYKYIEPYKDNFESLSFRELEKMYSYIVKIFLVYRKLIPLFYIQSE